MELKFSFLTNVLELVGSGEGNLMEGPHSRVNLVVEEDLLVLRATNGYGDLFEDLLPCYGAKGQKINRQEWVRSCVVFLQQHEAEIVALFNKGVDSCNLFEQPDRAPEKVGRTWSEIRNNTYRWWAEFDHLTIKGKNLQDFKI